MLQVAMATWMHYIQGSFCHYGRLEEKKKTTLSFSVLQGCLFLFCQIFCSDISWHEPETTFYEQKGEENEMGRG